ncbi:MAG TPA: hypothetical protein VHE14_08540 [Solirubrobacteraceae bacterium]|nr:hypothetical protein [Solirubrobacteraceae bacterium]
MTAIVEDVGGAVRRRRQGREPRIRLHAPDGTMETLEPAQERGGALLEAAEAMLDAALAQTGEAAAGRATRRSAKDGEPD